MALQREQRKENDGVRTAARIRVQRQQRGSLIAGGFGSGTETGSGAVLMARYYSRAAFGAVSIGFPLRQGQIVQNRLPYRPMGDIASSNTG